MMKKDWENKKKDRLTNVQFLDLILNTTAYFKE